MNITVAYNRFYHSAVLNDLYKKSRKLVFRDILDTRTQGAFTIYKHEDYSTIDELKQLLKILNLEYAVDESTNNGKLSTKDIDSKALGNHIEYCFKLASENGIEFEVIKQEWDELIRLYNR